MSRTTFSGPVKSGTNRYAPYYNAGTTVITQTTAFAFTAAGTTTNTLYIPSGSQILSFTFDTVTAFTGGTGAVTVGNVPSGTQYVSSTTVTSAGRVLPTASYTAAQLTAFLSTPVDVASTVTGSNPCSAIAVTAVAGTGATAGNLVVTVTYIQSDDRATFGTQ